MAYWNDEMYFSTTIFDHSAEVQTDVFSQPDGLINCFDHAINGTVPDPSLGVFTYVGSTLINYVPCYHWFYFDKPANTTIQYYDTQTERVPARMDFASFNGGNAVSWLFTEFDDGPQDSNLFVVDPDVEAVCNQVQ